MTGVMSDIARIFFGGVVLWYVLTYHAPLSQHVASANPPPVVVGAEK